MQFLSQALANSVVGAIQADADAATVTFNLALGDTHAVTLGGDRTLALSGGTDGQVFTLLLQQDATGGRVVIWFANLTWVGGSPPPLCRTGLAYDIYQFVRVSSSAYFGWQLVTAGSPKLGLSLAASRGYNLL